MRSIALVAIVLGAVGVQAQAPVWGQCGGWGWTGPVDCLGNSVCVVLNEWYSQCLPATTSAPPSSSSIPKPTSTTIPKPSSSSSSKQSTSSSSSSTSSYKYTSPKPYTPPVTSSPPLTSPKPTTTKPPTTITTITNTNSRRCRTVAYNEETGETHTVQGKVYFTLLPGWDYYWADCD